MIVEAAPMGTPLKNIRPDRLPRPQLLYESQFAGTPVGSGQLNDRRCWYLSLRKEMANQLFEQLEAKFLNRQV